MIVAVIVVIMNGTGNTLAGFRGIVFSKMALEDCKCHAGVATGGVEWAGWGGVEGGVPCPGLELRSGRQCCEGSSQRQRPERSSQRVPGPESCTLPPKDPPAATPSTAPVKVTADAPHEV